MANYLFIIRCQHISLRILLIQLIKLIITIALEITDLFVKGMVFFFKVVVCQLLFMETYYMVDHLF